MLDLSPMSLLALRQAEYTQLRAEASERKVSTRGKLRTRVSDAYYATVRRAYLRARAARIASSGSPTMAPSRVAH